MDKFSFLTNYEELTKQQIQQYYINNTIVVNSTFFKFSINQNIQ